MRDIRKTAIKNFTFTNWSETFSCSPEFFFIPQTEEEIVEILQFARNESKQVRVVGCGHSPSDIACTNDILISLQYFGKVLNVDEERLQITVQAGVTLHELNNVHLPKHSLALSSLGSISNITVGGALSTATHGTGIHFGTFSSYVVDLTLMTANGKLLNCSRAENEEVFLAALCGLGSLGIILTVTLQCERAFNLLQNRYSAELKDVIEHLDVHLQSSDHFRFMWFPYTDSVIVSHLTRSNAPILKPSLWKKVCSWFWDYAIGYYALEFCYYISTMFPSIVPTINRVFFQLIASRPQHIVDVGHTLFNFECLFKQYVTEWAVDKDKTGEVLWQLKQWIETNNDVYVHFPVEVRFVKADDVYISPAYGRDSCYINIIMYRPYGVSVPHEKYWQAYENIMEDSGGRPHWAKAHNITRAKFEKMYPKFGNWWDIRSRMDPLKLFFNSYLGRIFQEEET